MKHRYHCRVPLAREARDSLAALDESQGFNPSEKRDGRRKNGRFFRRDGITRPVRGRSGASKRAGPARPVRNGRFDGSRGREYW